MAAAGVWVVPVVLVVMVLTGCEGVSRWTEDSIINGCRFEPNVDRAVTMECDYDSLRYTGTTFRPGQIPSAVQIIRISNAKKISIADDTFSDLTNLRGIHFNNIRTVRFDTTNWTQIERPELMTITINNTGQLDLGGSTFSGWQSPGPKIIISNVSRCSIPKSDVGSDSDIRSVTLRNIRSLGLYDGAFRADIGHLQLENVTLFESCRTGTFGGRISNFLLTSVRIREIRSGCFQAGDGWGSLTIRSSRLGDVQPLGISGSINDVVIEDSHFGRVSHQGLYLNTSTFTINATEVEELSADALDVQFDQFASMKESKITHLRTNAFRRMRASTIGEPMLIIRQLSADNAEDGSLAFPDHERLSQLDVVLRDVCKCGVAQWALHLMLAASKLTYNITDEQAKAAQQVVDQVRCTSGTATPTLAEFHCRSCSAKGSDRWSQCLPVQTKSSVGVWVWPVCGVALLLLLLLTAGAVLTLARRRRSQPPEERHRQPPTDRQRNTAAESLYAEIPANLKYDGQQNAPTSGHQHYSPQPEPEYSAVDASDLPPPGVRSTQYVEMSPIPTSPLSQPMYANCDDAGQQQALYENRDAEPVRKNKRPLYANL